MKAERRVYRDDFISKYAKLNEYIKDLEWRVNALEKKNYYLALTYKSHRSTLDTCEIILKNFDKMDKYSKKVITFKKCLSRAYPLSAKTLIDYFDKFKNVKIISAKLGITPCTFYKKLNKTCEHVINKYEFEIKRGGDYYSFL